ncbi:hypothetical protein [Flavobacterium sp. 3HN19-14]|uniref:hypothetical protein n=1 Tax=Flavobacterium sp. 3HN19-14 TaxID=3448133 RepID=UPI003EE0C6F6
MKIIPFSKFLVRTPVFSLPFAKNILDADGDEWIAKLTSNKIFMHGLLVASPVFYNEVLKFEKLADAAKKTVLECPS